MINNFEVIEEFFQFEPGTFYKFECLVRNTDGNNILYEEGFSKTNKNILVKSWYVDNLNYYEKIKPEMIKMCDLTGARLYMTLDRKDNVKLVQNLIKDLTDTLCDMIQGKPIGIKSLSKTFASWTSKVETSSKSTKTLMWDVDTKNPDLLDALTQYISKQAQMPYILETKKGYHVFCRRRFDHSDWKEGVIEGHFDLLTAEERRENALEQEKFIKEQIKFLSVKENELGLVYHPMKGE